MATTQYVQNQLQTWPTMPQAVIFSAFLYIFYCLLDALYNLYLHPLSKFPGPKILAFSRMPVIQNHFKGKLHIYFKDLHERYGPIVRIAPNELITINPSAWKEIYQARPLPPKDPYSLTPPLNDAHSLFTASGDVHSRLRRLLSNAFSEKALSEQAPVIEIYVGDFVKRLRREIFLKQEVVDVSKLYGYLALDTIGELAFGESLGTLQSDQEHDLIRAFARGAKFGSLRSSLSRFYPWDMIIGWVALRFTAKARAKTWDMMSGWIDRRVTMGHLGTGRSDFVTPVIDNIDNGRKDCITRDELVTNMGALALAGSGLTTVALTAATYFSLRNPGIMQRLKDETRARFQSENDITILSVKDFPFLDAVLNETLRLHHATPSQLPRLLGKDGMMVGDQWIPGYTVIGVPLHAIQTSSLNWVAADSFCPQRWLSPSDPWCESRFESDKKDAWKPFSTGPRNCIGNKVFWAEARLVLAKMAFCFDLELVDPHEDNWVDQPAFLIYELKPLMIRLKLKEV